MYTTNPHERLASNGRARCLPSAHRAFSLGGRSVGARWPLAERSADDSLGHCSARLGYAYARTERVTNICTRYGRVLTYVLERLGRHGAATKSLVQPCPKLRSRYIRKPHGDLGGPRVILLLG